MQIAQLLNSAIKQGVADIYLLPQTDGFAVKYHVNGQLVTHEVLSNPAAETLLAALKYRGEMNVSEKRRPQLGRFDYEGLAIRVSTVGDYLQRETAVLRILYDQAVKPLSWLQDEQFNQLMQHLPTAGLVVLAGPTGSGKTSTLYAVLKQLANDKLVLTIEDPVEIRLDALVQLQVNDVAQMDYEALIKVALRHHPDVLLIGEIRDQKTAQAALQAALSGHLVLTTLHALSPVDILARLQQLGLSDYQLQAALSGAIYQRLIPTHQGQSALLDMRFEQDLQAIWRQQAPKRSQEWQEVLQHAVNQRKITPNVAQKYS
jgi:competence protein ComGA